MPGGGAALLHLAEMVPEFRNGLEDEEERLGADIVMKSLTCVPAHLTTCKAGSSPRMTVVRACLCRTSLHDNRVMPVVHTRQGLA